MLRNGSAKVMIEVLDFGAVSKQFEQRGPIGVQRDVQHGHGYAGPGWNAGEQFHVALDTGDQQRLQRLRQSQLMQRADSVGVTIEHIEMFHALSPYEDGASSKSRSARSVNVPRCPHCGPHGALLGRITVTFAGPVAALTHVNLP
jgi:hypothetical protein